jgi:hypothetical protein
MSRGPNEDFSVGDVLRGWRSLVRDERLTIGGKANVYGSTVVSALVAVLVVKTTIESLLAGAQLNLSYPGGQAKLTLPAPTWVDALLAFGSIVFASVVWGVSIWMFIEVRELRRRRNQRQEGNGASR